MSHANATLTPITRLRLARLVVEAGWTYTAAAKMFMVAPRTAKKWAVRYRAEGPAGMADRTSRPHHCPIEDPHPGGAADRGAAVAPPPWARYRSPAGSACRPSTVHAVLVRCRINRLSRIDRVTGEPLRRYEHDHPGSLIHVDVTKFGNIPDGGGWRYVGRVQSRLNAQATHAGPVSGARTTNPGSEPPTCTPSSTGGTSRLRGTTPASPTPKSAATRKPPPPSAS